LHIAVKRLKTSLIEEILKSHTTSSKIRNWNFSVDLSISARAAREDYLTSNLRVPAKIS